MLRFDRRGSDGEILRPYAGHKDCGRWVVRLYLPFPQSSSDMPKRDFTALPVNTAADLRARADRQPAGLTTLWLRWSELGAASRFAKDVQETRTVMEISWSIDL